MECNKTGAEALLCWEIRHALPFDPFLEIYEVVSRDGRSLTVASESRSLRCDLLAKEFFHSARGHSRRNLFPNSIRNSQGYIKYAKRLFIMRFLAKLILCGVESNVHALSRSLRSCCVEICNPR